MTFLDFLLEQLATAYGPHHAPVDGRVLYMPNSADAARWQRLEAERLDRENNARLRHAWRLAS